MKPKFSRQSTIRSKMMWMFLVVLLPLFAANVILLFSLNNIITETTLSNISGTANSLKMHINDIVSSVEASGDALCENTQIIQFLDNSFADPNAYYSFYSQNNAVETYLSFSPQVKKVYIYTEREDFVGNSVFRYADSDITSRGWYISAVQYERDYGKWQAVVDSDDGEMYLSYVRAIRRTDGEVVGVCVLSVSNDWISNLISDESYNAVFSVQNGFVYYSTSPSILCGYYDFNGTADYDILTAGISTVEEGVLAPKNGYTAINTFVNVSTGDNFQIYLIVPESMITDDTDRFSVAYGGYYGLLLILSLLMIVLFASVFSRRIKRLSDTMHSVAGGDLNVDYTISGNDEIAGLFADLEQMVKSMHSLMDEVYRAEIENESIKYNQIEAEFKALASQINPHFLYNTLETIRMKAYYNNDKETATLVKKLGKFMRRCLEFKDGEVTLRSELEFTRDYLELQTARFGDRVFFSIYSEVDKDYMILPLIIQPLVENAFVHGIEGAKGNGRIDLSVYYHGEYVIIDVADNGQGMSEEKIEELRKKWLENDTSSGKGIGLTNVNKRIKMYHGEQYGLNIKSRLGEGTTISVKLPRNPLGKSKPELLLEKYNAEKNSVNR